MDIAAPTRAGLDRAKIIEAALDLLDRVGLQGLSTRRLASELGVKGPSLYWHFRNKDELLAHMAAAIFLQALPAPDCSSPDFDLFKWLASGARGLRAGALARRDGAVLMARAIPLVDDDRRAFGEMTQCLHVRSGLPMRDCSLTLLALGRFATGWSLYEHASGASSRGPEWDAGFEFGLETFLLGVRARIEAMPKG